MSAHPRTKGAQWETLFALPDKPALPLQQRLRLSVVQAILDRRLPGGAPLPSSRELATLLGLSRNTVTAAYTQLMDDGFLESRPRSGVFVVPSPSGLDMPQGVPHGAVADPAVPAQRPGSERAQPDWGARVVRSLVDQRTLAKPDQWRQYRYPFVYGTYDPLLFPSEAFRECCVHSLARSHLPQWTPDFELSDVPEVIEQIRLRLLPKRGVFALPEEILITVGAQHAYYLLAEALFDTQQRVGLEEPGHPHARNSFALRAPQFVPLPVDAHGLIVDDLPRLDYCFVTPSHQSPTTHTLSMERRTALLAQAERKNFVVIEDDYEAENLYQGQPMPALKSLDKVGRVIYVGSVSKSLSPSLRLGYIVAPRALIAELRELRHAMLRHPSAFLQHAFALFLSLGHHETHARRVNAAMQERMQLAAAALATHLPDFSYTLPSGGASLWVQAPAWVDAAELGLIARSHGVLIEAGDVFFQNPPYPCNYFRLRLSSIPAGLITSGIESLGRAVEELARARGAVRKVGLRVACALPIQAPGDTVAR
ncbi:MAG: PLP-dependent aminotransferase family protein [Betaproteobacteria bacterium]|nr:PLP-dependent aminotransferase family protein [Betaproteobacteria bacterium]